MTNKYNQASVELPSINKKYVKKEADKRFFRNPVKDPTKSNDTAPVTYEAIIQFLPLKDVTRSPVNVVPYYDIQHNGKKMFGLVGENEKTDPVVAFRSSCPDWKNKNTKDFYKKFFPKNRIYCNILVRKNPNNPAQDGQVMLYNMSASLYKMCQEAMNPVVVSSLLDEAPEKFNPFNPTGDKALHLVVTRGSNSYPEFSKSKWVKIKPLTDKEIEKALDETNDLLEFNGHTSDEDLSTKLATLLSTGLDTTPVASLGAVPLAQYTPQDSLVKAAVAPPMIGDSQQLFTKSTADKGLLVPAPTVATSDMGNVNLGDDDQDENGDSLPF